MAKPMMMTMTIATLGEPSGVELHRALTSNGVKALAYDAIAAVQKLDLIVGIHGNEYGQHSDEAVEKLRIASLKLTYAIARGAQR